MRPAPEPVRAYLLDLQERICASFESADGAGRFREDPVSGPGPSLSRPRVLEDGAVFERAAVHFTHSAGSRLPGAASERHPELAGRPFEAVSLSLITHPRNPYVPTSHANLRFFQGSPGRGEAPAGAGWWFGGGFDLTPFYPFEEDVIAWHRAAREACAELGEGAYAELKRACDEYFRLPHRDEARGVGGLFFDDLAAPGFDRCFAFVRSVGEHYLSAYGEIVARRRATPYGERERTFQLHRRGRYVEFNLLYDRGTRYGLQSGRRIEAVLASLPPRVAWSYDWKPDPGTPEGELVERFLQPRDWLSEEAARRPSATGPKRAREV
ncbi:MAG: oxygen-dependent coproporphyrinogen oxidase [Myxococcota bacterium]